MRELRDDLFHKGREDELEVLRHRVALGLHDLHLFADAERVVGAHLRTEAILERCDDAAARRVVLGVGARDDEKVERQSHAVAANLHVLLFHDVEQTDLDALGQVRQLVDAEDAAVRARQQAVVDGQLVSEVAAFRDLDRVDLADQVGDRDVGRGELFAIAAVAADPCDLDLVSILLDQVEAAAADRLVGMVVDFAPRDDRHGLVEE